MFTQLMFEFILIGFIGGLLGIFYRNCLKSQGMIFNFIYYKWLKPWAEYYCDLLENNFSKEEIKDKYTFIDSFKAWIAYPLGYCIYCSTTWITFFLCILYLSSWDVLPKWQDIVIGIIAASGVQHLVVALACKWLIHKHPDL